MLLPMVVINGGKNMVLDGSGRLYEHTKGKVVLYIPADLHKDSQFPFNIGEQVKLKVDPKAKKMIVEKYR